jgi:hypothetical protein
MLAVTLAIIFAQLTALSRVKQKTRAELPSLTAGGILGNGQLGLLKMHVLCSPWPFICWHSADGVFQRYTCLVDQWHQPVRITVFRFQPHVYPALIQQAGPHAEGWYAMVNTSILCHKKSRLMPLIAESRRYCLYRPYLTVLEADQVSPIHSQPETGK